MWGTCADGIRQVEVNQLDSGQIVEGTEDVFGLDIAVDKAPLMDVLQGRKLTYELASTFVRQMPRTAC